MKSIHESLRPPARYIYSWDTEANYYHGFDETIMEVSPHDHYFDDPVHFNLMAWEVYMHVYHNRGREI